MFSSRSLLAAAALASGVLGASCAHSDSPTSTGSGPAGTGGDAPSGVGGGGAQGQGGDATGPVTTGGGAPATTSSGGGQGDGGQGDGGQGGDGQGGDGQGGDGQGGDGQGGGVLASFDPTGTELVSGGVVASSPGYTVILSVGQPSPVQTVMTSSGYRFEGGLLGVNGSLP